MNVNEEPFAEVGLNTEEKKRPHLENDKKYEDWYNYCKSCPETADLPDAMVQMMAQFLHKRGWEGFDRWYSKKYSSEPVVSKPEGQLKRKKEEADQGSEQKEQMKEGGVFIE